MYVHVCINIHYYQIVYLVSKFIFITSFFVEVVLPFVSKINITVIVGAQINTFIPQKEAILQILLLVIPYFTFETR